MGAAYWEGVTNTRDLGGLPLPGGGSTVSGVVIRSAALDTLTAVGREQLLASAPARIIDLRSAHEITQPSPFAGHRAFRHLPFVDPIRDGERDPSTEKSRSDLYRGSLYRNARHVARIWTEIAEVDHGLVIVHCRSGVDRTGMLVALLLSVAGVDRRTIAEDYAAGSGRGAQPAPPTARDGRRPWMGSPPTAQTMIDVLDWLDADYGGAAGYLRHHGVAAAHITAVRRRLAGPASATHPAIS